MGLIVCAVLARLESFPPISVLRIPADRLRDSVLDANPRGPTQASNLVRRNGVALVVPRPEAVPVLDQRRGGSCLGKNHLRDGEIAALRVLIGAHVVNFASFSLFKQEQKRFAMVFYSQPIPYLAASVVEGKRKGIQGIRDESGISFSGY